MPDYTQIDGVDDDNISTVSGVAVAEISAVSGQDKPAGVSTATMWLAGSNSGKVWISEQANATSWEELVDFDSYTLRNIAVGENGSGEKRFCIHTTNGTHEIRATKTGNPAKSDMNATSDWEDINVTNGHAAQLGGPGIAWGNGTWIAVGTDATSTPFRAVMSSSNGGDTWGEVGFDPLASGNAKAVAYKSSTTWFYSQTIYIYKSTDGGEHWANARSGGGATTGEMIYAMAYGKDDSTPTPVDRWVSVGNDGEIYYSDDDWDTATAASAAAHGGSVIHGVVYCGGTVNKWVACGASGKVSYSDDGDDWTIAALPGDVGTKHLRAVATDNTTIVVTGQPSGAVGTEAIILTSTDAVNWTLQADAVTSGWTIDCITSDVIGAGMR